MLIVSSCEDETIKKSCAIVEPVENIKWLKEKVQERKTSEYCQVVQRGTLNGHSVFVIGTCAPNVISIKAVYDCEGNLLCYNGDETCPDFDQEVKALEVIWQNGK
ncbi:DUF6970 domain-containing protein [Rufibacter ruber]|uniref:DUF6970 domain-containing protein n=1 Tax=Rufibacter ruber TaxID=1783499 RepID=UPI00082A508E|nr:hypothetical protein [Rufibacter ruber]